MCFSCGVADHIDAVEVARCRGSPRPQLLLLIHGGPGVGKTWTVRKLLADAEIDTAHTKNLNRLRSLDESEPVSDRLLRSLATRPLTAEDLLDPAWQGLLSA